MAALRAVSIGILLAVLLTAAPAVVANDCKLMVNGVNTTTRDEVFGIVKGQKVQKHQLVDVVLMSDLPCQFYLSKQQRKLYVRGHTSDIDVLYQIVINKEFGDIDSRLWQKMAPARIMDLGANVGFAAGVFASRFPKASIISVEPSLGNFAVAALNTRKFSNIRLVHGAVWSEDAVIGIGPGLPGEWGFAVGPVETARGLTAGHAMPGYTIDQLMDMMGWDTIDWLKVDIEGGEKQLFSTTSLASGWLNKVVCLSIELHERWQIGCCEKPLTDAMATYDFKHIMNTGELQIWCRKAISV